MFLVHFKVTGYTFTIAFRFQLMISKVANSQTIKITALQKELFKTFCDVKPIKNDHTESLQVGLRHI